MKQSAVMKSDFDSLGIPEGLIELLIDNSLNREQLSTMTIDGLALLLRVDIEAAKIILNALANSSNYMTHNMTELR